MKAGDLLIYDRADFSHYPGFVMYLHPGRDTGDQYVSKCSYVLANTRITYWADWYLDELFKIVSTANLDDREK